MNQASVSELDSESSLVCNSKGLILFVLASNGGSPSSSLAPHSFACWEVFPCKLSFESSTVPDLKISGLHETMIVKLRIG